MNTPTLSQRFHSLIKWCLIIVIFCGASRCDAGLVLNSAGISAGLRITTFADGFPLDPQGIGPNGSTTTSDGKVLVADFLGNIYRFNDVDGQTVADALNVTTQFSDTGSTPCLANSGGTVYLARERQLFSLNNDGTLNSLRLGGARVTSGGLVANPVTGHLYANSNIDPNDNLADIDVAANTYSLHPAGGGNAGGVSLDGSTVYVAHWPNVFAFDTQTYAINWVSPQAAGSLGVVQNGPQAGNILGYDQTTGELLLFSRTDGSSTLVAAGSLFNDGAIFGIDLNDGSLLMSLGSTVFRISTTPCLPVITCPPDVISNATSPSGVVVSFATPVAGCPEISVTCQPPSGSTFPIGTNQVICTASDDSGHTNTCRFNVIVLGPIDQLTSLITLVQTFDLAQGIANSFDVKLEHSQDALEAAKSGSAAAACGSLQGFLDEVQYQSQAGVLTPTQAAELTDAAQNIQTVLGCP